MLFKGTSAGQIVANTSLESLDRPVMLRPDFWQGLSTHTTELISKTKSMILLYSRKGSSPSICSNSESGAV